MNFTLEFRVKYRLGHSLPQHFMPIYKFSPKTTVASRSSTEFVIYNWETGESVAIFETDHPIYILIKTGVLPLPTKQEHKLDIDYLIDVGVLVDTNSAPKEKITPNTGNNKYEKLHLVLLPAGEACNLNCTYCYEDHFDKKRMGADHINRIISLCKNNLTSDVHIDYFGGEPLLNLKFIKDLAINFHQVGINFSSSITTNGTLITEDTLKELYESGVKSFQITLDGTEYTHNRLRPSRAKNRNSYFDVTSALVALQQSKYNDIAVIIRTNVNEDILNEGIIDEFIKNLKVIIPSNDSRFVFFPKPIGDYTSSNLRSNIDQKNVFCSHKNVESTVYAVEEALDKNGYRLADGLFMATPNGYSCYAGKSNSYVITPDFIVRKCTVAFNDPINKVGELSPDGNIKKNTNFSLWTKNFKDQSCSSCFLENSCGGNSCPLANIKSAAKCCPPVKKSSDWATIKIVNFIEKTGV